uniref:Flap endonuclease n=1 Tax=Marseillevirus LCMAC101 TaxID=2506602 RepID=A0A481YRC1_9VIRU|nr:MAG: flap endonuclease [Marseillevirus LCMAC101]
MGINHLFDLVRAECPEQLVTYRFDELFGWRVAVDISIFLYKYTRAAGPEKWINPFIILLCTLKKNGIKTVCIFDGKNSPKEKEMERKHRRIETQKQKDRMKLCEEMRERLIKDFLPTNVPIEGRIKDECKRLICPAKGRIDTTDYRSGDDVVNALTETYNKLDFQTQPITEEHQKMAQKIVKLLGLACFVADGEAETLCAYLAIKGEVDAVLTEDGDILTYGTPLMLRFGNKHKLGDGRLEGIHTELLLEALNLNQEEFRDLCILLRCDYNRWNGEVKGYPPDGRKHKVPKLIGQKAAWTMVQEYRRLEEVSKYLIDPDPLIFRRCRELFTIPKSVETEMVPLNKPIKMKKLIKFIEEYKVTISLDYILNCWKPPQITFHDSEDEEIVQEDFIREDMSKEDSKDPGYLYLLSFSIENDETGKDKSILIPAKFTDEEQFLNIADEGYDMVLHLANDYLAENGYSDSHIEMIEACNHLKDGYQGKKKIWDLSYLNDFGWPRK